MSMFWDDVSCDFPYCGKEYDKRSGKRVALVKDGEIMCFCAEHCKELTANGVRLRMHSEVLDEQENAKYAEGNRMMTERQKQFIKGLKKSHKS